MNEKSIIEDIDEFIKESRREILGEAEVDFDKKDRLSSVIHSTYDAFSQDVNKRVIKELSRKVDRVKNRGVSGSGATFVVRDGNSKVEVSGHIEIEGPAIKDSFYQLKIDGDVVKKFDPAASIKGIVDMSVNIVTKHLKNR